MAATIGVAGWLLALGLALSVLRLRRRLELVAEAAHELRGPLAAFAYAVAWLRREPGGVRRALRFEAELARMRAGLTDLDAARAGRRAPTRRQILGLERLVRGAAEGWQAALTGADRGVTVRWEAGAAHVHADRGRLSQALGNVLANAAEHGSGPVAIDVVRASSRVVRIEIRDGGAAVHPGRRGVTRAGRGRGLRIARQAIRAAGGSLELACGRYGTVAAIELPLAAGGDRLARASRARGGERRSGAAGRQAGERAQGIVGPRAEARS